MAVIIYYALGIAILGYGLYLMSSGIKILSSLEWLNSYASVKVVPPKSRVNFSHVGMWITFNTAIWVWLFFGIFFVADFMVLSVFILNALVNYLITKLSGSVRVKVTYYRTWALITALTALCIYRIDELLPGI
jgi:hypothetical protein